MGSRLIAERSRGRSTSGSRHGESGMTLVEVMVAILILGVLLSSVAVVLITSLRASAASEQRVLATAAQSQVQEDFQAIPWALTGIYQDELDELEALLTAEAPTDSFLAEIAARFDFGAEEEGGAQAPTFDGRPVVVLIGPNCPPPAEPPVPCEDRELQVPAPWLTREIGDQAYDVFQIVTWDHPSEDVRRLTSVVRWVSSGREYVESFDSVRARPLLETGGQGAVQMWLDLTPRVVILRGPAEDLTFDAPIRAFVRFLEPPGDAPTLRFFAGLEPDLETGSVGGTLTMSPVAGSDTEFEYVVPAGSLTASVLYGSGVDGPGDWTVLASSGELRSAQAISFESAPIPEAGCPTLPVVVRGPSVIPADRTVRRHPNSGTFREDLELQVYVDNLKPRNNDPDDPDEIIDETLTATVWGGTGPLQFRLAPPPGPVLGTNQPFGLRLAAGQAHGLQNVDQIRFVVHAARSCDGSVTTVTDPDLVTFTTGSRP